MFPIYAQNIAMKLDLLIASFSTTSGPGEDATQTVKFANGTTAVLEFTAGYIAKKPFDFATGEEAWTGFCAPSPAHAAAKRATPEAALVLPGPTSYPKPVVRDNYNLISGSEGPALVLSEPRNGSTSLMSQFSPYHHSSPTSTKPLNPQRLPTTQPSSSTRPSKTAERGWDTNNAYDLFRALFPEEDVCTAARYRDNEALRLMFKTARNVGAKDEAFYIFGPHIATKEMLPPDQKTQKPTSFHGRRPMVLRNTTGHTLLRSPPIPTSTASPSGSSRSVATGLSSSTRPQPPSPRKKSSL
ncbi:uncharacterized protein ATNIH1004_011343 [Aspergillus tanneri]|uniref:Uncharacterized protein n=1 Tax=Aspergillus tanneri TaxID=1220188 RepID=A0A5M9MD02_9EURO|nr:uncharacterized protein ATNIH1004_011343 [Aspergillus tanneri]KAA8642399.1 hypothetical protein ATNIH1004_011343 [Aspergillus tanneri]